MLENLPLRLYWAKNWVIMVWSIFRKMINKSYDSSLIPKGMYCYAPDIEKNQCRKEDDYCYYTKPCPYYKTLGKEYNGCMYLGIITDDIIFDDQCKMCSTNMDFKLK